MKEWRFRVAAAGKPWVLFPSRMKDPFMNGFFIGYWFIGWMR